MNNTRTILGTIVLWCSVLAGFGQGTAFTYQGRLSDNASPANGIYDLRFAIYDAVSGGVQQGTIITNSAVGVTNGIFTVTLDFGNQFPGSARWLEIGVRTSGAGAFATLNPRQPVTATPYAVRAAAASSVAGTNVTGTVPLAQLPGSVVTNGATGVNLTGTFTGNGAALSSLNATALASGTVADARLSANVALRSGGNTFSGDQIFTTGNLSMDNVRVLVAKNSAGTYENVFFPRWSDNITYLNYGSGGFSIRNNANVVTMFMQNNGNVGIGTATAGFPLNFASVVGDKISLYGSSGNHFGFGIQGALLQIHADVAGSDIAFGHGQSSGLTENVRFKGNGNVGIGTASPGRLLHVGGSLGKEGLMRFASLATNGAARSWDVGVPLSETSTAGRFFSFVIDDTLRAETDFLIRWDTGFVGLGKTNPATRLDVAGEVTCTAVNVTSDRNSKEGFASVNARAVLDKVTRLPISEWQYKSQTDARHIGPMAQDFREAFGLGRDDKHITSVDADGVALAAIQGLNQKLEEQVRVRDGRIEELEKTVAQLKELVSRIAEARSAAR